MTSIKLDKIKALVEAADYQLEEINKGRKIARPRLRKLMQDLKTESQSIREQVLGLD